jgi:hypothetical protein
VKNKEAAMVRSFFRALRECLSGLMMLNTST